MIIRARDVNNEHYLLLDALKLLFSYKTFSAGFSSSSSPSLAVVSVQTV